MERQFDLPGIGQGARKFPLPPFLSRSVCPAEAPGLPAGKARFPAGKGRKAKSQDEYDDEDFEDFDDFGEEDDDFGGGGLDDDF